MMMPILDQSPAHHHHHHGHGHQTFYHQQHIPEQTGKMQLTLILPNGVPSVISVDATTPMMDLLVQAASLNKLNPSGYSLVVLDSNQHVIHFKANQTVGQIVKNCQLPQINGSSTISLLPKETSPPNSASKPKTQPFEITVRLQVNLPDAQKILLRVDPTLPLYEIKEQICKQKKYIDSNRYTLRLPNKLDRPLSLGLSLAEYKTNELTLIHLKQDPKLNNNQIQSFDRLYRTRSESQPPTEPIQEIQNEPQEIITNKQRPASVQLNPTRSPTSLPTRPTHPITSHTSLHAYWNDPNFDTQSQTSNCSSTTKKRQAPRPPGYISPNANDPYLDHHQSQESLTDNNGTKQKRKAPVVAGVNSTQENTTETDLNYPPLAMTTNENIEVRAIIESADDQQIQPQKIDIKMNSIDGQRLLNLLAEQQTPSSAKLVITTNPPEQNIPEPHPPTPIYSQIQKTKESIPTESPYSTPTLHQEEITTTTIQPTNYSVVEIVQAGIAEPPPAAHPQTEKPVKSSKKSTSFDGLVKIINDHTERAQVYQANEKQTENVSYFRVAKSRYGKFETDDRGFVNNSTGIFDSTNNQEQPSVKPSEIKARTVQQSKPIPVVIQQQQQQTKGKQAYDLLKKYEKEEEQNEQSQIIDTDYLKTATPTLINDKEKSPTPIQLEVTERTTHISVTVESDRKQLITRASPVPQPITTSGASGSPPIVAPKPFGKTITEYRTVKRIGNDGETTTTTTVRTETVPPTSTVNDDSANSNPDAPRESLMDSVRKIDGSQNLGKE